MIYMTHHNEVPFPLARFSAAVAPEENAIPPSDCESDLDDDNEDEDEDDDEEDEDDDSTTNSRNDNDATSSTTTNNNKNKNNDNNNKPSSPVTLLQPSGRKQRSRPQKLFHTVRMAFRSFPILAPATCRLQTPTGLRRGLDGHVHGSSRSTGTLFGHRRSRITLALQDSPRSLPTVLLELGITTNKFMQDLGTNGYIRLTLECEKKAAGAAAGKVLEEPVWTAFVNGRPIGLAARREAGEKDLQVMKLLHAVSMGAGVLPADMADATDGELTYVRAHFDRVVGSKDTETFYMLNPEGNTGPELSIFFVRI